MDCVYSSNLHAKHETIPIKKAASQVKQTQSLLENEIKSLDHFFDQNLQKSVLNLQTLSSSSLRSLLLLSKQFDLLFEKLTEAKEIIIHTEKERWEERRRKEEGRAEGFRRIRRMFGELLKETGDEHELGKQAKFIHSFNILKTSINTREVDLFDSLHSTQESLPNFDKLLHTIQSLPTENIKVKKEDAIIKKSATFENEFLTLEGRKLRQVTESSSASKKTLKFSNEESFRKSSRLLFKEPFYDSLILLKKLKIASIFRVIMPSEVSPNSFKLIFRLTKTMKEGGGGERGGGIGGRERRKEGGGGGRRIGGGEKEGGRKEEEGGREGGGGEEEGGEGGGMEKKGGSEARRVEELNKDDWWNGKRSLIGLIKTKKTISGFYLEEGLREEEEDNGRVLKEEEDQEREKEDEVRKWLFSIKNKMGVKPIRIQVQSNTNVRFSRIERKIIWGDDEYVIKYITINYFYIN